MLVDMSWIYGLQLRFPAPFRGIYVAYVAIYFSFVPLWYRFPSNWRKEKDIRRKFKFYILSISVNLMITMIYTMYTKAFISVDDEYQWGAAILLIPIREFNLWLQTKVGYKTAELTPEKDSSISITCGHNINNRHCFFLSVVLGTIATDVTCWVILAIDFSINLYLELKIIWTKYRTGFNEDNEAYMVDLFIDLIINETVEIVVPFTYFICFTIAYYGPNAELIGTVKSEYWHHVPVKDYMLFCENVGLFLVADVISLTLSFCLFWFFCKVNIVRAFSYMQKEYWMLMAVNTAYAVNMAS